MIRWLRRILGIECCGPWSPWETHEAKFSRIPFTMDERIRSGWQDSIEFTRRWQERHCTVCGKIQQREMNP